MSANEEPKPDVVHGRFLVKAWRFWFQHSNFLCGGGGLNIFWVKTCGVKKLLWANCYEQTRLLFFSLLYGTPANSAESQLLGTASQPLQIFERICWLEAQLIKVSQQIATSILSSITQLITCGLGIWPDSRLLTQKSNTAVCHSVFLGTLTATTVVFLQDLST